MTPVLTMIASRRSRWLSPIGRITCSWCLWCKGSSDRTRCVSWVTRSAWIRGVKIPRWWRFKIVVKIILSEKDKHLLHLTEVLLRIYVQMTQSKTTNLTAKVWNKPLILHKLTVTYKHLLSRSSVFETKNSNKSTAYLLLSNVLGI